MEAETLHHHVLWLQLGSMTIVLTVSIILKEVLVSLFDNVQGHLTP